MSKLPNISTSIFSTMSQLAAANNAINLSQGFPNFPVDQRLIEITVKLTKENVHQYAPMAGYPPLLDKIALLTQEHYQRKVDPVTEILITTGATQGIFTAIQALVKTGDEVIVLDPSYDSYEPSILLASGKSVRIPLYDDYTVNWEAVAQACTPKTRMIIINNPHNPTGKILNKKDIETLENILDQNPDLLLLSDEVYEYITFEEKHISANSREKLRSRSIIASSFGKSFHITGWKIGYLIAPENLMHEIKKVHQFLVFSVNSLAQAAICQFLDFVDFKEISSFYQKKRDYFRELLAPSRFNLLPS
ncbi:aminotransferase class I/II-fold pyridoxal phosphate-dependent enzyme [Flavobacterium faecale]|uniref:aminotransferase class I/II-fold pyridoxal phosphate-dependent enzyme n=1 Tax=Flavobacterium faecale TaxID=1355330 RepID=UPI003AB042A5